MANAYRTPQRDQTGTRRGTDTLGIQAVHVGADYSDDELEFMLAMDAYKREHRRPFPSWSEVLGVLLSLGYRKVGPVP